MDIETLEELENQEAKKLREKKHKGIEPEERSQPVFREKAGPVLGRAWIKHLEGNEQEQDHEDAEEEKEAGEEDAEEQNIKKNEDGPTKTLIEQITDAEMEATMLEQIRASRQNNTRIEDEDIIEAAAEEYEELVKTDEDIELLMQKATSALRRLREAGRNKLMD